MRSFFTSRVSSPVCDELGGGEVGVVDVELRALHSGAVVQQDPYPLRSPAVLAHVEHGEQRDVAAGEGKSLAGLQVWALETKRAMCFLDFFSADAIERISSCYTLSPYFRSKKGRPFFENSGKFEFFSHRATNGRTWKTSPSPYVKFDSPTMAQVSKSLLTSSRST